MAQASADDLTRDSVKPTRRVEAQVMDRRRRADYIAAFKEKFCSSTSFAWLDLLIFCDYLAQSLWSTLRRLNPYLCTFLAPVMSLEAIFLLAFIRVSQNYKLRISDRRNQFDL